MSSAFHIKILKKMKEDEKRGKRIKKWGFSLVKKRGSHPFLSLVKSFCHQSSAEENSSWKVKKWGLAHGVFCL